VAARIWSLLDGVASLAQVIDAICGEYDVSREQAAADVGELIADLEKVSLVLQVPEP
jgi:hypothetical protein